MKQPQPYPGLICILIALLLAGCNDGSPQQENVQYQTDGLFLDYQAIGYEDRAEVVVRAQFRLGGPEGEVMWLKPPAAVYLDDQLMDTGSTKMTGGYYEAVFDTAEAAGKLHVIHYRDASGYSSRDSFYFPFFHLVEDVPETVNRSNGLEIRLKSRDSIAMVHTLLTDTSFYGRGLERFDTIRDGLLNFSPTDLRLIRNGPIHLEFYLEKERWLQGEIQVRGRLYLSYNISREFELMGE